MKIKRPMKGEEVDETKLRFPLYVSPKLDGFRSLKLEGKSLSSSFKPIRNVFTRETIEREFPDDIDGELMLADPHATFSDISSAFSSFEGEPNFVFFVFDIVMDGPFEERIKRAAEIVRTMAHPRLHLVPHIIVNNLQELLGFEHMCLSQGYEGIMVRSIDGPYKAGRSTVKEGYLLKLKRFKDSEAEILGFVEQMHNNNEKKKNELGLTKRSTKKENMIPAGTLGKFLVRDIHDGTEFEIGTGEGLTHELRKKIWDNQPEYLGKLIKYKYQEHGMKDKPRIPIWLGFRSEEDMSV